jgi:hypothetical protein
MYILSISFLASLGIAAPPVLPLPAAGDEDEQANAAAADVLPAADALRPTRAADQVVGVVEQQQDDQEPAADSNFNSPSSLTDFVWDPNWDLWV